MKEIDFHACQHLPVVFPSSTSTQPGSFRVGAAVTAIAAALPS